jgi:hypothetical protein
MRNENWRASRNATWIENYCADDIGRPVKLTASERQQLSDLYAGRLAGFLAQLHRDGPERRAT